MQFSFGFGVSLMCATLLLFLPARGTVVFQKPTEVGPIIPSCCIKVSKARIRETVVACFEQREYVFANCKIHAYIFWTQSGKKFCVDPNASWLPERLRKLQAKGISCDIL